MISHLCLDSLWLLCGEGAEEGSREAREGNAGSSISLSFFSLQRKEIVLKMVLQECLTDCQTLGTSDGLEDSLGQVLGSSESVGWSHLGQTELGSPPSRAYAWAIPAATIVCCPDCFRVLERLCFTTCCMGYIFLLYFLSLLLLLFWYLRSTSVDICLGQIGYYPCCCPQRQRQPI